MQEMYYLCGVNLAFKLKICAATRLIRKMYLPLDCLLKAALTQKTDGFCSPMHFRGTIW